MSNELPASVRALLTQVHSHEELSLLRQLGSVRPRSATARDLADSTSMSLPATIDSLDRLVHAGLLHEDDTGADRLYSVHELHLEAVTSLAREYEDHLVEIITELSANAVERVRSDAMRAFADAFVIKGRR